MRSFFGYEHGNGREGVGRWYTPFILSLAATIDWLWKNVHNTQIYGIYYVLQIFINLFIYSFQQIVVAVVVLIIIFYEFNCNTVWEIST